MRRRGDAKAIVAVGHEILLAAYRVLATAQPYTDPGPTALSRLTAQRLTRQPSVAHKTSATRSPSPPAPTQHENQYQHESGIF
jgi:hypothetical protein